MSDQPVPDDYISTNDASRVHLHKLHEEWLTHRPTSHPLICPLCGQYPCARTLVLVRELIGLGYDPQLRPPFGDRTWDEPDHIANKREIQECLDEWQRTRENRGRS